MDFDLRDDGSVDIWFVERAGKLRHYDGVTGAVRDAGSVPVYYRSEHGLTGIALDPGFPRNRRLFLAYSVLSNGVRFRLARYSLGADGKVDLSTAKVILDIPATEKLHTLSALKFDKDGNLFVAVADNMSGAPGAGSTDDLRGKILRIRPTEEGGYSIPAGNLFPPAASGQPLPGARPEIYVMGVRQPYSLAYDPATGRLAWGEFGPDQGKVTEEHNVTAEPGNFGWPFFAGRQDVQSAGTGLDPAKPVNAHPENTGLREHPPARPAIHAYRQSGAVTGPLYRHKPGRRNPSRVPGNMDGLWFLADFNHGGVDTARLDSTGTRILAQARLPDVRLRRPVDFQQGPDGGLYVINYSGWYAPDSLSAILRLVWNGCPAAAGRETAAPRCRLAGSTLHVTGGRHTVRLRDASGRLVRRFSARAGTAPARGPFPRGLPGGSLLGGRKLDRQGGLAGTLKHLEAS